MKVLLVVLTLIAVIRPEHLLPVLLVGAGAFGVIAAVVYATRMLKGAGHRDLTLAHGEAKRPAGQG